MELPQAAFTNKKIYCDTDRSVWFEYCPSDKQAFNQMMEPLLIITKARDNKNTILGINEALYEGASSDSALSKHSSIEQWLKAYWSLYLLGRISIGYKKEGRAGIKVFSTSKPDQTYQM